MKFSKRVGIQKGLPELIFLNFLDCLFQRKCGKNSPHFRVVRTMSHLTRLPDDLLCSILQFLDAKSLLCEMTSVNLRLHDASLARGSWRVCNLTRAAHAFDLNGSQQKTLLSLCLNRIFTSYCQLFCFLQMPPSLGSPRSAGEI